jgi:hypothetical protein
MVHTREKSVFSYFTEAWVVNADGINLVAVGSNGD